MKIDAKIEFNDIIDETIGDSTTVSIDMDFTESTVESVQESVEHKLYEMFGRTFTPNDYEITNMSEILEELAYDEFLDKTT